MQNFEPYPIDSDNDRAWKSGVLKNGIYRRCHVNLRLEAQFLLMLQHERDRDVGAFTVARKSSASVQTPNQPGLVVIGQHPLRILMEFLTNNALFHCDHNWHAGVVFDAHTFFQGLCPICDELIPPTFTGICCDCGITHPPYTEILTNSECDFEVMRETNTGIIESDPKAFVNASTLLPTLWPCIPQQGPWTCPECGYACTNPSGVCKSCLTPRTPAQTDPCLKNVTIALFHDTHESCWKLRCEQCESNYRLIGHHGVPGHMHCSFCTTKCRECAMQPSSPCYGPNAHTCCDHISTACQLCKLFNPYNNGYSRDGGFVHIDKYLRYNAVTHWCPDSERRCEYVQSKIFLLED